MDLHRPIHFEKEHLLTFIKQSNDDLGPYLYNLNYDKLDFKLQLQDLKLTLKRRTYFFENIVLTSILALNK